MANRYWVGGTASWDGTAGTKWALTSGGAGGEAVPTSADDVFFDGASGAVTCTIATGNTGAKSINCTGFTGTLAHNANITVSGSITLSAGMTYTKSGFVVTLNGTGTLTTAGKQFSRLNVNGAGITVTLGDNLNVGNDEITVTAGTFTTSASNYSITAALLQSSNSNTRTISLNASTVTLTFNGVALDFTTSTNLTFNAGTSQINLTNNGSPTLSGGGRTFYNFSFTGTSAGTRTITGANTFNNLTLIASANGISDLSLAANQIVNGTFTCAGSSAIARGFVRSDTIGTARTITAAVISANDCDFRDITIAGAASPISPTRAGDCGGNTNITFPAAKTVYWNLAGTQNWNATGWATTSSGSPAVDNFPLAQDTATFTDSGSAGTVSILGYNIGAIDASTRTSAMTLDHSTTATFYGSYTLGSGVTITGTSASTFSGRSTMTFTSASKTITFPIAVDAPSSTFQLGDNFNSTGSSLGLTRGTFNANNFNVTCRFFGSSNSNTRTLTMGSGLWTISGSGGSVWFCATTTNLTFNKDTANILFSSTASDQRTFAGGGLTYNKVTIGGATGASTFTFTGTNTFSELASTKTVAYTINFNANQTITTWSIAGSSGNLVTINGNSTTLTITNRTSAIDYLDVSLITAPLAPVTFYAGANSRLRSNVRGVAAIAPTANEFIYVLTSGTSFTVPADWNSSNNEIHLFAGGGGGGGVRYTSSTNRAGGGGGGGGGYTKVTNLSLTPSSSVSYAIGSAGSGGSANGGTGTAGGNTTFNAGAYTTTGGGGGSTTATPTSTGGTAGTGSTFNGGVGGVGFTTTSSATSVGSGGGAGAGGPLGVGANGGNGSGVDSANSSSGGGGGGNGGGSAGSNASGATAGAGGNNNAGVGSGAASTTGFNGGGGGGGTTGTNPGSGSVGVDIAKAGMGGGGGSGGRIVEGTAQVSGLFGAGGGGSAAGTASATVAGLGGAQGGIIIVYQVAATATGNMFMMFR